MVNSARRSSFARKQSFSESCSSGPISRVSFGQIQVREFERIAGDHPDLTDPLGPALAIGWAYHEREDISLEDYEAMKQDIHPDASNEKLKPLNGTLRTNILLYGFGVSKMEIDKMTHESIRIQKQRRKTATQGRLSASVDNLVGDTIRKVRRSLTT